MPTEGFKRKLTAIFSADVVDYSRLMGEDEESTVKTLENYKGVMSTLINEHRGRVVDSTGDNLLSEFGSVVDAVQCAVAVQKELQARNEELPENRRMLFRIGINLGDVIEEKDRIYGDGVNIAARLEALADPGGICISKTIFEHVESKLPLGYAYMGEKSVKNIPKAVGAYRVLMEPRVTGREEKKIERASDKKMAYPLPDKPSIAVLPFTNMSGDPSQEFIGDGFSENIISALSLSSRIFVIARNSTFTYKATPVKVQQVAEELGVQYVLEGSIQKSGDRLRVTAQLIDALSGHHLWSEKYDRRMDDLFEVQDEITKKIVVDLQVELTKGEEIRVFAKSTDNLEAWNCYLKGLELFYRFNEEDNAKAREHFEDAIKLDPKFVSAFAHLASTHRWDAIFKWSDSPPISLEHAFELLQRALRIDEQDAFVHAMLGGIYLSQRQYEKAITEGKRAITLNPNFSLGYAFLAVTMLFSGWFDEAITLMKKAYRLDPNLPAVWLHIKCFSYMFLGRYDEALEVINQIDKRAQRGDILPKSFSSFMLMYSFLYQEIGNEEKARAHMDETLKIHPNLSLEYIKFGSLYKNPAHLQRLVDAYRKAGMPEKSSESVL